ncbi:MAG: hypothetical protein KatS3mg087_1784 [Patescibacteria group bacterium]|nr:MAG: hypothetical protein KatS3mg087_1784 [Patescibacteria group bacterium]
MQRKPKNSRIAYNKVLQDARARHDNRFDVDYPRPEYKPPQNLLKDVDSFALKVLSKKYIVWAIIALAGAIISMPHTLALVSSTVALPKPLGIFYAVAVFVGVELSILFVTLNHELTKTANESQDAKKIVALTTILNSALQRLGLKPYFDTSHLPDRSESNRGGKFLIVLLFGTALLFNIADTVINTDIAQNLPIAVAAKLTAGALGPVLLLSAGHYFAREFIFDALSEKIAYERYQNELAAWHRDKQRSWLSTSADWIQLVINEYGWHDLQFNIDDDNDDSTFLTTVSDNGHNAKYVDEH